MYILYLVSAIALSTGVGAFTHYDSMTQRKDVAAKSRAEVAMVSQDILSRSLRREFQLDPTRFPQVTPGQYTRLDESLINLNLNAGFVSLDISAFYIGADGQIMGLMLEGELSPEGENGDLLLGISGQPQFAEGLIRSVFAESGRKMPSEPTDEPDREQDPGVTPPDQIDGQILESLTQAGLALPVGQLDLAALGYSAKVAAPANLLGEFAHEPDDFRLIAARWSPLKQ